MSGYEAPKHWRNERERFLRGQTCPSCERAVFPWRPISICCQVVMASKNGLSRGPLLDVDKSISQSETGKITLIYDSSA